MLLALPARLLFLALLARPLLLFLAWLQLHLVLLFALVGLLALVVALSLVLSLALLLVLARLLALLLLRRGSVRILSCCAAAAPC